MTITGSSILQRDPGATVVVAPYGPRGPVIAGTSSSSADIAPGGVVFTMNEYGLGFSPGIRLRASAIGATDQWLEGVATDYTGNLLTILVDLTSGDGIYDSWQINVAGEQGQQGPIGPVGATGQVPEAPEDSKKYVRYNGGWLSITGDLAGFQPLDGDLTALAALTGTNTIYYRSATNTWTPVTMGSGIGFTGGVITALSGGGNVSNSGTPTNGQLAQWIDANRIQGIDLSSLGFATLSSPIFTGDPRAPTPAVGDNDTSIATTAFVASKLAAYLPLAGGTVTGSMAVSATLQVGTTSAGSGDPLIVNAPPTGLARVAYRNGLRTWSAGLINNGHFNITDETGGRTILDIAPDGGGVNVSSNWVFANPGPIISSPGINYTFAGVGSNAIAFLWDNPIPGSVGVYVDNIHAYALASVSDERLKADIESTTHDCLNQVLQIPLYQFRWMSHSVPGDPVYDPDAPLVPAGFVAQRLYEVAPYCVRKGDDATIEQNKRSREKRQRAGDTQGTEGVMHVWDIDQNNVIATLVGAIQQLASRVAALEAAATK